MAVRLEQLTKTFSDLQKKSQVAVLQDIDLAVAPGEFLVLVGPSGCGKSTLLRLIAGLEAPTAGHIWVGDRRVNDLPPKARDIAMVFQSYALYPHLTVYDNLAFGLRRSPRTLGVNPTSQARINLPLPIEASLSRLTRILPKPLRYSSPREQRIDQRIRAIATMLQIEALLNRYPKQLSGGQKQRVALGRAMARNPQVFLMDEPLSNLDAKLRTETRAQIVQLQRQLGVATIYVTHDQTEAMTMGDRIAVLNQGKIQQLAPPLELYQRPANQFVAEFIGSPPMNFLPVQVTSTGDIQCDRWQWPLPQPWQKILMPYQNKTVILGIRAEHLMVLSPEQQPGLPVSVQLVENLGHETSLSVGLMLPSQEGKTWRIRLDPSHLVQVGDRLGLDPQPDQLHFFDAETGQSLPIGT
ncbi:ABC transporter ATP-binding protein [Candidatus Synechococcus calcipolaris G9]|uniref:ABC transporter ATP-binding protein n=1 Tax=Candidatus Synechococcus calcipolaris G9 TaxID=1497997 RepID=A0ABT6EZ37_9SYNE|nr:ABC transporter ATP-binding protein [Candidatus Synechococcus calcipolaris]MDG2990545.1 ABC transporter ATP-binding protein [Candidatus Synechococcus calcipolaris G9]